MAAHPEWLAAALARIKATASKLEVADSAERAAELGVPIGTTVRHFPRAVFTPDAQQHMDDMRAMGLIRAGIVEMPAP